MNNEEFYISIYVSTYARVRAKATDTTVSRIGYIRFPGVEGKRERERERSKRSGRGRAAVLRTGLAEHVRRFPRLRSRLTTDTGSTPTSEEERAEAPRVFALERPWPCRFLRFCEKRIYILGARATRIDDFRAISFFARFPRFDRRSLFSL